MACINYKVKVINDIIGIDININWLVPWEMMTNDNDEYHYQHGLITR
jgi:hypothetical protein